MLFDTINTSNSKSTFKNNLDYNLKKIIGRKIMDLVLLNEDELEQIDGGVNAWGIASGALSVLGGGFAIAAACADPEPVSKGYAIKSGVCWIASGVTGIISVF